MYRQQFLYHFFILKYFHTSQLLASRAEINNNFKLQYILHEKSVELNLTQLNKETFIVNETIKIKFKSSPKKLYEYFVNDFYIPLSLYYNETTIGNLNLKFDLNNFLERKSHFFEYESKAEIISVNGKSSKIKKCFIEFKLSLTKLVSPEGSPEKLNVKTIQKHTRKTFSFNFILKTVKFNQRPDFGTWQISFHNSKADTPFTVKNVEVTEINSDLIDFNELKLSLFFSGNSNEVPGIINSEPCILSIIGPKGISLKAELDNENLLTGTNSEYTGIIFMKNLNGEHGAIANAWVYLDDFGLSYNSQVNKVTQPKPFFDENLAYKAVEEIEMWKSNQMEHFLIDLKRKESEHLANLSSEWLKKRLVEENKLAEKMEECVLLTNSLEEAHKKIENKSNQEQVEDKMEYTIKENSQKFEYEMNHILKLEELRFKELEISKNALEKENEKFKVIVRDLENRLSHLQEMPKEQFLIMFEDLKKTNEKLETVQKSKNFYKEQWAKNLREVHKVKANKLQKLEQLQLEPNTNMG